MIFYIANAQFHDYSQSKTKTPIKVESQIHKGDIIYINNQGSWDTTKWLKQHHIKSSKLK